MMAEFLYNKLRSVFNKIPADKDHFVDTVESAAKVAVWLAEQPPEASFVASQIFLQLSVEAAAKIPPNEEGQQTIETDWSSFEGPYKAFLTLTRQVAANVEAKLPSKPEVNKEQKILEAIYESLRENTSIRILFEEEMAGSFVCEGLVKFLREYWNSLSGAREEKEKQGGPKLPAILDVASLKQLVVLIARFVGLTSVKLAFSEEAEFIQVWKPNEFGSGVWFMDGVEHGMFPRMKDVVHYNSQYYEFERKIRVSAGFHLASGNPQLLAHRACQIFQKFKPGTQSLQSYRNLQEDSKLPKAIRDLVEHLLVTLCTKKYLQSQPLALSVLGALKSRCGEPNAEGLLKEAVSISQRDFNDAYTVPYSFLAEHHLRAPDASGNLLNKTMEECQRQRMVLVPRMMMARSACKFQLCFIRDDHLIRELMFHTRKLASELRDRRVYPDEMLQQQPLMVALILSFLDYFFLWQSKKIRGPKSVSNTQVRALSCSDPAWLADVKNILRQVSGVPCRNIIFHSGEGPAATLKAQPVSDMTPVMAFCRDPSPASGSLKEATQWFYEQQGLSPRRYREGGNVQMVLRSETMRSLSVLLPGQYKARGVNKILDS